jgi:hypothetical protein
MKQPSRPIVRKRPNPDIDKRNLSHEPVIQNRARAQSWVSRRFRLLQLATLGFEA